jgi:NAD+ synthase
MSLVIEKPQQELEKITQFLQHTFISQKKKNAVIAVSGGIDSALSLTLLTKTLPAEQIFPLFLPYKDQSIEDNQKICQFLQIPEVNWQTINIAPIVDAAAIALGLTDKETFRKGNLMARARMIAVFDVSKAKDALVCGTENKSEHYLGYFTRFGDAASDIEPICHLYKTQVRQLVEFLQLPEVFLSKAPSAGLWAGQTDEQEMGFTYEVADQVLEQLIDQKKARTEISLPGLDSKTISAVATQVRSMAFKLEVPYTTGSR